MACYNAFMRRNTEQDFWDHVDKSGPCWTWTGFVNPNGYGHFSFNGKNWLTHRLSLYFTGVDITNKLVCHHCDNPSCVRPGHLYAGSLQSNAEDAKSRNRLWTAPGSSNPRAKLTEQQVEHIRCLPFAQAMETYGHIVSRGQICHIRYNKDSWRHI